MVSSSARWTISGRCERRKRRDPLPALFYADEASSLMDQVLAVFGKHRAVMRRPHEPEEDWFGLAAAQEVRHDWMKP